MKRVEEGEIIIMMTDKSGKFAVADVESLQWSHGNVAKVSEHQVGLGA